jgi:hypothetical protein
MRATQKVGTWDDLPVEVLEDAFYEPTSDDLLDLLLDYGQHLYTRDKPASRIVVAAYRRIAHLEKKLETLTEQRNEARRDAVEAEAYATEVEAERDKAVDALRPFASLADRLEQFDRDKKELTMGDFRRARITLNEIEAQTCHWCREPLSLPSGDGCASMAKHARSTLAEIEGAS